MATIKTIKTSAIDKASSTEEDIWPITSTNAVFNSNNVVLDTLLTNITTEASKKLPTTDATTYYGPLKLDTDINGETTNLEGRIYAIEELYSDYLKNLTFMDDICGTAFSQDSNGVKLQIQVNTRGIKGNGVCWAAKDTGTAIIPLATTTTNGVMSSADKTKLDSIEGDTTPLSDKSVVVIFYTQRDTSLTITEGKCPDTTFTQVYYNNQKNVFYVTVSRKNYTIWDSNPAANIPSSDIYNTDLGRAKHIFKQTYDGVSYYFGYAETAVDGLHYYNIEELREVTINLPELDYPKVLPITGILSIVPTIQNVSVSSVDAVFYIYDASSASVFNKTFVARKDGLYYSSWSTQYHNNHEYNTHPKSNMYTMQGEDVRVMVDTGEMVELGELTNYF